MQKYKNAKKHAKRSKCQKRCQEGQKAKNADTIKNAKVTSQISNEYDAAFWNQSCQNVRKRSDTKIC